MTMLRIIFLIVVLFPSLSNAQIKIRADTLTSLYRCRHSNVSGKVDHVIIDSEEKYSEFDEECIPFGEIDFEKNIVVLFLYGGSNCDEDIVWSTIGETNDGYLIQFETWPPNVCRDAPNRIAVFIIERPGRESTFTAQRVFRKKN